MQGTIDNYLKTEPEVEVTPIKVTPRIFKNKRLSKLCSLPVQFVTCTTKKEEKSINPVIEKVEVKKVKKKFKKRI